MRACMQAHTEREQNSLYGAIFRSFLNITKWHTEPLTSIRAFIRAFKIMMCVFIAV